MSSIPVPEQDIAIYTGDYFSIALTIVDADGDQQDQTGWTYTAQLRDQPGGDNLLATFGVDTSNESGGVVVIYLSVSQTTDLANSGATDGYYDVKRSQAGETTTLVRGKVSIVQNVTQP